MQLIWKVLCDQAEHLRARNAFLANLCRRTDSVISDV
jgi:hypothetical protein